MRYRFRIGGFSSSREAYKVYNDLSYIIKALTFSDKVLFRVNTDYTGDNLLYFIDGIIYGECVDIIEWFQKVYRT